jgi:cyclopropane fatty-acyl-phospholipid synthase-like methyltransferase
MNRDFFETKAETYDADAHRVANVENIANAVIQGVRLDQDMHLMDFGSGTGLLLERIAPYVRKITAVDISQSMIDQLDQKRAHLRCEVDILNVNLVVSDIIETFDGIISSMTMHHVEDIEAMFRKFYSLLKNGGVLAISDLDKEDGSFHTDDSGAYHFGFEREVMIQAAKQAGFREIAVVDASVVHKPHGQYPLFLLTAKKPD